MPGQVIEMRLDVDVGPDLEEKLRRLDLEVDRLLQDALDDIALRIEYEAKGRAGFVTGNLKRNIGREPARRVGADTYEAKVGVRRTAPYGLWHHEGTGIFGARRRRIRPLTGNVLVFRIAGRLVFARSVKGQRANPFLREAFVETDALYVPARLRRLAEEVGNL